jgi:hypothetical protein
LISVFFQKKVGNPSETTQKYFLWDSAPTNKKSPFFFLPKKERHHTKMSRRYHKHDEAYSRRADDAYKKEIGDRIFRPIPQPYKAQKSEELGEYQPDYQYVNTVRDFYSTQGLNPNERVAPLAHIDWRTVEIGNDSDSPLNIGINNDPFNPPDGTLFTLQPEERRYILINSYGGSEQYLWPFWTTPSRGPQPACPVAGPPRILANNANSFVLKSGVTGIWIVTFQYPTPKYS